MGGARRPLCRWREGAGRPGWRSSHGKRHLFVSIRGSRQAEAAPPHVGGPARPKVPSSALGCVPSDLPRGKDWHRMSPALPGSSLPPGPNHRRPGTLLSLPGFPPSWDANSPPTTEHTDRAGAHRAAHPAPFTRGAAHPPHPWGPHGPCSLAGAGGRPADAAACHMHDSCLRLAATAAS